MKIHVRRPELSRDEFQRRLLGEHADLVLAQDATRRFGRRYAQLHNIGSILQVRPWRGGLGHRRNDSSS